MIAATLGSAISLGNIRKFPSLTGANGGAAEMRCELMNRGALTNLRVAPSSPASSSS